MIGLSLPNLISIARLMLVPLIVSLMLGRDYGPAFGVFVIAGVSDAVDGFIARRFAMQSQLGAFLDPIADKALLVSVFLTLGVQGQVPQLLVTMIVARDLLIVGAVILSYVVGHPLRINPSLLSKANTAAQIFLAGLILAELSFASAIHGLVVPVEWLVAATTVASGCAYCIAWFGSISAWDRGLKAAE